MTAISLAVVNQLGLKPISVVTVHDANATHESPVFKIDLLLPNHVIVQDVNVSQATNIIGGDILIGMDIITLGDFAVTNANGVTCFSFRFPPGLEHINFVADANRVAKKMQNRQMARRMAKKGKLR